MRLTTALACVLLCGCATTGPVGANSPAATSPVYQPPVGSNLVLEGHIDAAPGHHLVMGDLVATPGMVIPRHTHSGEEFLYVIGGTGTLSMEGEADVQLAAGKGVRIPAGAVHGGVAGEDGLRAVSTWIVVNGQPLRTAAPE